MPRKPSVRWYAKRGKNGGYYTQINKKQIHLGDGPDDAPLGPNYERAYEKWKGIMRLEFAETAGSRNTLRVICELYLEWLEPRHKATTYRIRRVYLKLFTDQFGEVEVHALTPFAITSFLDKQRSQTTGKRWESNTVATAISSLQTALNWAVKSRVIPSNPLKGMDTPAFKSRSRMSILSEEEEEEALQHAPRNLKLAIRILQSTGCRPSELLAMSARNWNANKSAFVFKADEALEPGEFRHKTSSKGKDRVVRIQLELVREVKETLWERGLLPLVLSPKGVPYTRCGLVSAFKRIGRRMGSEHYTAYCYRHTFATRYLLAGGTIDLLACMLGNTPEVIRRTYSHLEVDEDAIRDAFDTFHAKQKQAQEADVGSRLIG
jgi:integrase